PVLGDETLQRPLFSLIARPERLVREHEAGRRQVPIELSEELARLIRSIGIQSMKDHPVERECGKSLPDTLAASHRHRYPGHGPRVLPQQGEPRDQPPVVSRIALADVVEDML